MDTPQFLIEDMEFRRNGRVFRCEATPIYIEENIYGDGDSKVIRFAARVFEGDNLLNRDSVTFHDTTDDAINAGFAWIRKDETK